MEKQNFLYFHWLFQINTRVKCYSAMGHSWKLLKPTGSDPFIVNFEHVIYDWINCSKLVPKNVFEKDLRWSLLLMKIGIAPLSNQNKKPHAT